MPRRNRKARPRLKRRSVTHLFSLLTPQARRLNQVWYTLGSAPLPGSLPLRNGKGFVRVFPVGPDVASRARKRPD